MVMRRRENNSACTLCSLFRIGKLCRILHENTRSYKDRFRPELHDERCVGWRGNSAGAEIRYWQLPRFRHHLDQLVWSLMLFSLGVEFFLAEHGQNSHFLHNLAD